MFMNLVLHILHFTNTHNLTLTHTAQKEIKRKASDNFVSIFVYDFILFAVCMLRQMCLFPPTSYEHVKKVIDYRNNHESYYIYAVAAVSLYSFTVFKNRITYFFLGSNMIFYYRKTSDFSLSLVFFIIIFINVSCSRFHYLFSTL